MTTAYTTKGRALFWAVITGIASALGYLVAELLMQHDLSSAAWGMIGIFVLLTVFSYFVNARHIPKKP